MFVVEMQMHYVMDVLRKMAQNRAGAVECRQDVHDVYNDDVDRRHTNMVWTHPGMETYYRNRRGRVVVNSPHLNATYFALTRTARLDDFVLEPRRDNSELNSLRKPESVTSNPSPRALGKRTQRTRLPACVSAPSLRPPGRQCGPCARCGSCPPLAQWTRTRGSDRAPDRS